MRINKYIASAGVCSRRKADKLIEEGNVKVNGAILSEPGYDVGPDDEVLVNGKPVYADEEKVYYLLNKPVGVITSASDESGRPTVTEIMDVGKRVFPVGRLDFNTSGVLIMTNDGEFSHLLMHPANEVDKTYRVRIAGSISKEDLAKLRHGVDIGGYVTKRAKVDLISWTKHSTLLDVTIHEGKNRQVRRMFKAVGKNVEELERTSLGGIELGRLKPGQYRKLNPNEVERLRKGASKKLNPNEVERLRKGASKKP